VFSHLLDSSAGCIKLVLMLNPHHHTAGFEDVKTMLSDPDLAPIGGPQLQQVVDK